MSMLVVIQLLLHHTTMHAPSIFTMVDNGGGVPSLHRAVPCVQAKVCQLDGRLCKSSQRTRAPIVRQPLHRLGTSATTA